MTSPVVNQAILDTSIYIDNFRSGKYQNELLDLKFVVRASAVVLAELGRGVVSKPSREFVESLAKNLQIVAPEESDWLASGELAAQLARRHGFDINKLRALHFDVLIALTARRIGAYLITSNRNEFEKIRAIKPFKVIYWT
ncbi:MAG: PIN domain-containing protein [Acidobacteria bacterium]|nr:PIN domain-containing protein [Acidobacteriota bacterium]MBI3656625.1 PIN domain-containing protein [Acidobacteriota bacterium]